MPLLFRRRSRLRDESGDFAGSAEMRDGDYWSQSVSGKLDF